MTQPPRVLLTNDDGIDSPGLAALYEALGDVADVTAVAPADDQSGVGRSRSSAVTVDDHERGYAVHGTPADCAAWGLSVLDTAFDVVVSGCNHGPNVGEYLIGHSGTVGAAVEAAFLGTPAVAVSAYHREEFHPPAETAFDGPASVTRDLVERLPGSGVFHAADYLNVNAPMADPGPIRVTEPLADYEVDVWETTDEGDDAADGDGDVHTDGDEERERDGEGAGTERGGGRTWRLRNDYWARLERSERHPTLERVSETYPAWSDRRALVDGDVSLSALRVPQETVHAPAIDELVAAYNGRHDPAGVPGDASADADD